MALHLREINSKNVEEVRGIEILQSQKSFIESVDECLQEAEECDLWHPVAIYLDEVIIGFAMYGTFHEGRYTWIDRIMIDKNHQGRGLGRGAMELLMDVVPKEYKASELYLSFIPENVVAAKLYRSLGFFDTGKTDPNGEVIYQYNVK